MEPVKRYGTLVVDPPWEFRRGSQRIRPRYGLMDVESIKRLPVAQMAADESHLYLWIPNAFLKEGHEVMAAWGFEYKTMVVWVKHQMGMGNYYRNATEVALFGVRGRIRLAQKNLRNWFIADRRQHSRKPDEFYRLVEQGSPAPRIDIFSREKRSGWDQIGDQCDFFDRPTNAGEQPLAPSHAA